MSMRWIGIAVLSAIALGSAVPAYARWPVDDKDLVTLLPGGTDAYTELLAACPDGAGGSYLAWGNGGPLMTFPSTAIQHLDAFGREMFSSGPWDGLTAGLTPCDLAPDGVGGVIVLLQGGNTTNDLLFERFSPNGELLWTTPVWSGTRVVSSLEVKLATDANGASPTVFWVDATGATPCIRAQRISTDGELAWAPGGAVVATLAGNLHFGPAIMDVSGYTWVSQFDGGPPSTLRLHRIGPDGSSSWAPGGVLLASDPTLAWPWQLAPDGANGVWISWQPYNPADGCDRMQRVRANGSLAMGATGIVPPGATGVSRKMPALAPAGGIKTYVAWHEGVAAYLYTGHFSAIDTSGVWQLPGTGVTLPSSGDPGNWTWILPNSDGTATVTALNYSGSVGSRDAQRLGVDGTLVWPAPVHMMTLKGDSQLSYHWVGFPPTSDGSGGVTYYETLADSGLGIGVYNSPYYVRVQHVDGYGRRGDTAPRIVSLRDWPNDQGKKVELRWHASVLEGDATMPIQRYDLLRVDPNGSGGTILTLTASAPAGGDSEYVAQVPTLADSTSPTSVKSVFRVRASDASGHTWLSPADSAGSYADGTLSVSGPVGPALALAPPRPNPARGTAVVRYTLPAESPLSLELLDLSGRRVRTLAGGREGAGEHQLTLSISTSRGAALTPGLYFVRLTTPGHVLVQRLVVLR